LRGAFQSKFQPSPDINIEISLKPDILPPLVEHATNLNEAVNYLLNISTEKPDAPLLSGSTIYLLDLILDCLSRAANLSRTGIAKYSEAEPGAFVIVRWRGARSGNIFSQPKACKYRSIRIDPYPDSTVGGGKAGLISEPTLYLLG
jgi:hypothetical protein